MVAWRTICSGVSLASHYLALPLQLVILQFNMKNEESVVQTGSSYTEPLSWNLRMKIALGAAKGLAFLHSPNTKVIYRDFKPSNILLDSVRQVAVLIMCLS